ncbi:MAG: hypothetical protein PHT95_02765 [Candidatus Omnitrophica bacterium]|nr:hypothetical protein [Candidatus Omnitrophota bacterium]MDD4013173.1 hypothetical protein [Candidatus Omnitrophota bacterium]
MKRLFLILILAFMMCSGLYMDSQAQCCGGHSGDERESSSEEKDVNDSFEELEADEMAVDRSE